MFGQSLRPLALTCKTLAIFVNVVVGLWLLPPRWGFNAVTDTQVVVLAILSLVPNRWLVFSIFPFVIFMLAALFRLHVLFISAYTDVEIDSIINFVLVAVCISAPLPLALIFSRLRFLKGERFTYA